MPRAYVTEECKGGWSHGSLAGSLLPLVILVPVHITARLRGSSDAVILGWTRERVMKMLHEWRRKSTGKISLGLSSAKKNQERLAS